MTADDSLYADRAALDHDVALLIDKAVLSELVSRGTDYSATVAAIKRVVRNGFLR